MRRLFALMSLLCALLPGVGAETPGQLPDEAKASEPETQPMEERVVEAAAQPPETPTPPAPQPLGATPPAGTDSQGGLRPGRRVSVGLNLSATQSGAFGGSFAAAGSGLGTGLSMNQLAAVATTVQSTQTTSQTPLLLPGLFTAASSEPIRPTDRFFLN